MTYNREVIENCFLLSVPSDIVTIATPQELEDLIIQTNKANAMVSRFLNGELEDYELLEYIEQYTPIDQYCENLNDNLESWTNERIWEE